MRPPGLPFAKPKGPIGSLALGMLHPKDAGGDGYILRMLPLQLIDLGKLDLASPPWLRLGPIGGDCSSRDPGEADRQAGLLQAFAEHHARSAMDALGLGNMARLASRRVCSATCPGQIGWALALRFDAPAEAFAELGMPLPAELSVAWGEGFLLGARKSLSARRQTWAQWEGAPASSCRASLTWAMDIPEPSQSEAFEEWGSALLAIEEAQDLAKTPAARKGRVVNVSRRRSGPKRI